MAFCARGLYQDGVQERLQLTLRRSLIGAAPRKVVSVCTVILCYHTDGSCQRKRGRRKCPTSRLGSQGEGSEELMIVGTDGFVLLLSIATLVPNEEPTESTEPLQSS